MEENILKESEKITANILNYSYQVIKENYNVEDIILFINYFALMENQEIQIHAYIYKDFELDEKFACNESEFRLVSMNFEEYNNKKTNTLLWLASESKQLCCDLKDEKREKELVNKIYYYGMTPKNFISVLLDEEKELKEKVFNLTFDNEKIKQYAIAFDFYSKLIFFVLYGPNSEDDNYESIIEKHLKMQEEELLELAEGDIEEYQKKVFKALKNAINQTITIHEELLKEFENTTERTIL